MVSNHMYAFVTLSLFAAECSAQVLRIPSPTSYDGDGFGISLTSIPRGSADTRHRVAVGRHQAFPLGGLGPEGRVFVFDAVTGELLRTLASPNPVLSGQFGWHIAGSLDTDHDNIGDIIVGANLEGFDTPNTGGGRAYQISGAGGGVIFSHPLVRAASNFSSGGVASLPDIDSDGIDDVVISSVYESRGRVHVYSGRTGERLWLLQSPGGELALRFGYHVAASPDMDGDGRGEILVASTYEQIVLGSERRGVAYVLSGATGQALHRVELSYPVRVASVPDVNGDGVPDYMASTVAVVTELPGVRGIVRVYSGATGETLLTLTNPEPQYGEGLIGYFIAGAPDLNHDGRGEILIGAPTLPSVKHPTESVGAVFVFSGANGRLLRTIRPTSPLFETSFGSGAYAIPDTNGDGIPELFISAAGERIDPLPIGAAYIFYSCPADWDADGRATSADFFGFLDAFFTVSDQADFNHDGFVNSQDFFDYLSAFFAGCAS